MGNVNGAAGAAGASLLFTWILSIAGYIYMALVLQTIAKKTNTENAWFAWIPILNIILMIQIAKKPVLLWFILLLIPFVDLVFLIIIWIEILKRRNYPGWWVILMLIPIVNIIIVGIVAWKDKEGEAIEAPSSTTPTE